MLNIGASSARRALAPIARGLLLLLLPPPLLLLADFVNASGTAEGRLLGRGPAVSGVSIEVVADDEVVGSAQHRRLVDGALLRRRGAAPTSPRGSIGFMKALRSMGGEAPFA